MRSRARQYHYSSPFGFFPSPGFLGIALLIALPVVFFATVPDRALLFFIYFGLIFLLFGPWPHVRAYLRIPAMQSAANKLGLLYSREEHFNWIPPDYGHCPDRNVCQSVLRGVFRDRKIKVFDSRLERRTCYTDDKGYSRTKTVTRTEYSVIQLQTKRQLPSLLLGASTLSSHKSIPVAGTKYHLHFTSRKNRDGAVQLLTDQLVEYLRQQPGLAIQVHGQTVTVYDDRSWTNRRTTAGNLPAFLEDVLHLVELLEEGLDQNQARTRFSLEQAVGTPTPKISDYRGEWLVSHYRCARPGAGAGAGTLAALGFSLLAFYWTIFGIICWAEGGFPTEGAPVILLVGFVFTFTGLGMMLPWILHTATYRPEALANDPVLRITGSTDLPGNRLKFTYRQRNRSRVPLEDVSVQLTLAMKEEEEQNSVWSQDYEHRVAALSPLQSVEFSGEFDVPENVPDDPLSDEWWGLDVRVNVGKVNRYESIFALPSAASLGREFAVPASLLGAAWGFWCCGILVVAFLGSALGTEAVGPTFGFVALAAFAGVFGGGWVAYKLSRIVARWWVVKPVAERFARLNPIFQLMLSIVLLFASLLAFGFAVSIPGILERQEQQEIAEANTEQVVGRLQELRPGVKKLYGTGVELDFRKSRCISVEDLEQLKFYPEKVKRLKFGACGFDREKMIALSKLPDLEFLEFNRSGFTVNSLSGLAGAKKLRVLRIAASNLQDKNLSHLPAIPSLTTLWITRSGITDGSVPSITRCGNLENLQLTNCGLTSQGIDAMLPLKNLKVIGFSDTQVDDSCVETLKQFPKLYNVYSMRSKMTDAGREELKRISDRMLVH